MKFKNTFLSILRHALTTIGGALSVAEDPQTKAIGIVMITLGGLWGSADEHKAENSAGGLNLPPAAMLMLCAILGMGFASLTSGCTTTQVTAPASTETQRLAAYTLTKNATLLVLQRDPAAETELAALATSIDTVFSASELTPTQIKAALDALKVSPKSQLLIASALTDAYHLYTAATGKRIVVATDPTATAILKGVQTGLTDGIAFARAFSGS